MLAALAKYKIIPVLKIKDVSTDSVLRICEALAEGGLPLMETAFRRHNDSQLLKAVKKEFPEFITGAGGIFNCEQLMRTVECGINFASAPGVCRATMECANKTRITFLPGAITPSDIQTILLNGYAEFQFFPAQASGGIDYMRAILEPFEHLPLDIFPKGNITLKQAKNYLELPHVTAVATEEILKPEYILAEKWDKVSDSAKHAVDYLNK
jgi:2-dehydro-3-deoxyphosphogluconate aldolase/(4S)-4-hydroxy-2-oxoglutarate aldolase